MHATCPACRFVFQDPPLFQLPEVPVQSVRLVADAESARSFSRGALTLLDCPNCGLVFNNDFQPESQRWDPGYEETQACSGHFNQFAAELSEQLVQRFDLKNKRILEIGCGKGHFLAALCRGGRNTGLGVDPAFDPARNPDSYEHCSNYDSHSLAATLNRFGIACLDVALCFHDQYLLATGKTGARSIATAKFTRSQDAGQSIRQSVSAWRAQLGRWQANHEPVVLWGGGSKAVAFLSGVGSLANAVAAVVDINPRKQGCFLPGTGHAVLAPADLARSPPDHIVIMNPAYRCEIAEEMTKLGISADLVDVAAATTSCELPWCEHSF